jgi:hypothetical protein
MALTPPTSRRRVGRRIWLLVAALVVLAGAAAVVLVLARSHAGEVLRFRSRPDLQPPAVEVRTASPQAAGGDLFVAAKDGAGQSGPMILDGRGRLLWFDPLPSNRVAFDFRAQRYRGKPVLTWWQGVVVDGHGSGEGVIADARYHVIATVHAGAGESADLHELQLTSRGTALLTVYQPVRRDLSRWGGPRNGTVEDSIVQEVEIATGRVVFQWHSLDHVGLGESMRAAPGDRSQPWDYFHINSIEEDGAGDLLISARNTSTVYKVDRASGAVAWRLGGKRSSFAMGPSASFVSQHDVRRAPGGDVTLFDNAAPPTTSLRTRALRLHLDTARQTATLVHAYRRPRPLLSDAQGSVQLLPGGDVFVGWGGTSPWVSEFAAGGRLRFEARFVASGVDSYRAYRLPWVGRPTDRPALALRARSRGGTSVSVSWNGATEVARWQVLAGSGPGRLRAVASGRREGFETTIELPSAPRYVAVRALDRNGRALGTSRAKRR